jgi:glycerol-3-phosphate dehydrogenase
MTHLREKQLQSLQNENFDILIIGGGATGSGIALDAASRGYKVALVEGEDFASGSSSRSTKLIHGGVRYLENAVKHFSIKELKLVYSALQERATLLKIAPHLTRLLPIFIPAYSHWEKLYFGVGMKIYDLLSSSQGLKESHFISRDKAIEEFPNLKAHHLKGGIVYYDGQFDDARMNISLLLTAISYGATIANYLPVIQLKKTDGKISSALVKDKETKKEWEIKAKIFVNATGPFLDEINFLDDPKLPLMIKGSSGVHIVLNKHYGSEEKGLLIPKTTDGRVLFLLPWEGSTLVGTTDNPTTISHDPIPSESEIDFIITHLNKYMNKAISRKDVKSSWCGIRPLMREENVKKTANITRGYGFYTSSSKLYCIFGGKWTSYRKMAEDLIDRIIFNGDLAPKGPCVTEATFLCGANSRETILDDEHLDNDIIDHLKKAYGDKINVVLGIAKKGYKNRLAAGYPYIEAEVIYATQYEFARTEMDILARRTRLWTLDQKAAASAFNRVSELMKANFKGD